MTLDAGQIDSAIAALAKRLLVPKDGHPIRLFVVGGSSGLLAGLLQPTRVTADVDVTLIDPADSWNAVAAAAAEIAREQALPETWLNNECRLYAWCLPLGWKERCTRVRAFPAIELWALSRGDFIAAKIVSARSRPQDLEDVQSLAPTNGELDFAEDNIARLRTEHLDPDDTLFDDATAIVESLRGAT